MMYKKISELSQEDFEQIMTRKMDFLKGHGHVSALIGAAGGVAGAMLGYLEKASMVISFLQWW